MKQVISQILIFCILVQTNFIAYGQVRTDGTTSTTVTQAANGVDVVNIANANSRGLSHNKYIDFNVSNKGLILNNAKTVGRSQLGGIINGNAGLQNQARLILNEVTSSNRSKLNGYIEVHGQAADVIIANPNGISCNGCGFINTPSATLTTGKPIVNGGELQRFDVNGGKVTIGELGLDATRADYFDIISRSVEVNGNIHAKNKLQVITGRNDVNYKTKAVTKKADDGSAKPEFSIDSSALGGMYAGAISLVGTEDGVGVKAPENAVASLGDFNISADGKIVINRVNTKGKLIAESKNSDIEIKQSIQLEQGGELKAAKITQEENAIIVSSIAQDGTINGSDLTLEADEVELNSEVIGAGSLTFKTNKITHGANADVKATNINIITDQDLHLDQGNYLAFNSFNIEAANLTNDIEITSANDININASDVVNNNIIEAGSNGAARIVATENITNNFEITAGREIELVASNVNNNNFIASQGDLNISATDDVVNDHALIFANGNIAVKADGTILNNYGDILAYGDIDLGGLSQDRANLVINAAGYIETLANSGAEQGSISIAATNIDNLNVGFQKVRAARSEVTIADRNPHYIQNHEWFLHFDHPGCCSLRSFKIIRKIVTNRDTITSNGDNSYILSAGDISLDADTITNDKSAIYASRDLAMTGANLNNVSTIIFHSTQEIGTKQFKRYEAGSGLFGSSGDHYYTETYEEGEDLSGETYRIGTIQAGGRLTGNLGIVNNSAKVQEGITGIAGSGKTESSINVNNNSFNLNNVLGRGNLFIPSTDVNSSFLYETRGKFVNTDDFLSSDYFLDQLGDGVNGFNADENLRRLGDSYIENRIIRDQIFNQTGLVQLDGFGSDMEQMQALYDNAAQQMGELDLKFGISLSPEQVANLTQDIIWMERTTVNGIEVLAPKLYLSELTMKNLDMRGSKIVAGDIDLTVGLLNNTGVIRADETLSLAGGTVANKGGLITGRDVNLDVVNLFNDTTTYSSETETGQYKKIGRVGEIIAENELNITAEENIVSTGKITSGGDANLTAGGTIHLEAVQETFDESTFFRDGYYKKNTVDNTKAILDVGGNLNLSSGGNINLVGADAEARGEVNIEAGGDVNLLAVEDKEFTEYHFSSKYDPRDDNILTTLQTGGLSLLFGSDYEHTVTTDKNTAVRTIIKSGKDLNITSNTGDVTLRAVDLHSEDKVKIEAVEGSIKLLAAIDSVYEESKGDGESIMTVSNTARGSHNETIQAVQIFAQNGVELNSERIHIDVEETIIDLSEQEGFEYLVDLKDDPRVNWNEIQAAHENWDYSSEGLSQTGALLVTIAVAVAAGPAAASLGGAVGGGAVGAAVGAGFSSVVSQAAVSIINNGGDLGAVFKELSSSDSLRSLAVSMATAGAMSGVSSAAGWNNLAKGESLSVIQKAGRAGAGAVVRAGAESAFNRASFEDSLVKNIESGGVNFLGELAANQIGNKYAEVKKDGVSAMEYVTHKVAHAGLGCALGAASGGECAGGAIGAVTGEVVGEALFNSMVEDIRTGAMTQDQLLDLRDNYGETRSNLVEISKGAAVIAAAALGEDVGSAQSSAENAVENNVVGVAAGLLLAKVIATGVAYFSTRGAGEIIALRDSITDKEKIIPEGESSTTFINKKFAPVLKTNMTQLGVVLDFTPAGPVLGAYEAITGDNILGSGFDENGELTLGEPLERDQRILRGVLVGGAAKYKLINKIRYGNNSSFAIEKVEDAFDYVNNANSYYNLYQEGLVSKPNSLEEK